MHTFCKIINLYGINLYRNIFPRSINKLYQQQNSGCHYIVSCWFIKLSDKVSFGDYEICKVHKVKHFKYTIIYHNICSPTHIIHKINQ